MAGSYALSTCVLYRLGLNVVSKRFTWVVARALPVPVTLPGYEQVSPDTKQEYQCYEVVQRPKDDKTPLVKVLLTKDVEGFGNTGEIVEVKSGVARHKLFLTQSAVYASEYNIRKYGVAEQLSATMKPATLTFANKTSRHLHQMVVNVTMNLNVPWTIEKWHIRVSFRKAGLILTDECVILPPEPISGPDMELESKLFRFYVIINRKVVTPCIGRIHHVTLESSKKIVNPTVDSCRATEKEKEDAGIVSEGIYIADDLKDMPDKDLWDLMVSRRPKPE